MQETKFEIYAIVELFGHSKMAGVVTEQTIGSASFVRIDVPETSTQPKFTRLVNPSAIYAINPVTEDVMAVMAESICSKPIDSWDIHTMQKKLLALKSTNDVNADNDGDDLPM